MSDYLRRVRLTWRQVGGIALLSAVATGLVIAAAIGHPSTPSAVLAALGRRVIVHRHPTQISSPAASINSTSGSVSASGPAVGPAAGATGSGPGASTAGTTPAPASATSPGPGSAASAGSDQSAAAPDARKYKVKHVFVIALSAPSYDAAFGHGSTASYLNAKLRPKGALLSGYGTLSGAELPDYLAMISGQAPNPDTRGDCASYVDFPSTVQPASDGVMPGSGCVYPNTVLTIGDQVTASGATWKAYIDGMGPDACIHPNSGAADDQALPFAGPEYDTRHNPFIYFHSLLDLGDCANDDVALTALPRALNSASRTPEYTFIAPNSCADGASVSCPDGPASGLLAEDGFLKTWVPRIVASPAYRKNGMLIIAFAAAGSPTTPTTSTTSSTSTTSTTAGTTTLTPATGTAGPVRTGALVLSPFTKPGRTVATRYNAYSLLRTTEVLLGFKALGQAAKARTFIASALPGA